MADQEKSSRTFPDIESESIGGFPAVRVVFAEDDATMWFVSKLEMFQALELRMTQKRLTRFQLYEIAFKIEQEDAVPAVFKEDKELSDSFLVKIFEEITHEISLKKLAENPYAPQLTIKYRDHKNTPAWYFSGPNCVSELFSNKKTAKSEWFEMKSKGEITDGEYVQGLALLLQRTDIPAQPTPSKKYDA